jgi:hypothetical protein
MINQSDTLISQIYFGRRILILLASCQKNLYDIYNCCVYSAKFLMMDRGAVRNR